MPDEPINDTKSPHWQMLPGMRLTTPELLEERNYPVRLYAAEDEILGMSEDFIPTIYHFVPKPKDEWLRALEWRPDWEDDATAGLLPKLTMDAWGRHVCLVREWMFSDERQQYIPFFCAVLSPDANSPSNLDGEVLSRMSTPTNAWLSAFRAAPVPT